MWANVEAACCSSLDLVIALEVPTWGMPCVRSFGETQASLLTTDKDIKEH